MARTNIDIDEEACRAVMDLYDLKTKKDAVNTALRLAAIKPMSLEEATAMEGTGWEGDLDVMRESRVPWS
jgi:Arc/MetJ family transcription regulator